MKYFICPNSFRLVGLKVLLFDTKYELIKLGFKLFINI